MSKKKSRSFRKENRINKILFLYSILLAILMFVCIIGFVNWPLWIPICTLTFMICSLVAMIVFCKRKETANKKEKEEIKKLYYSNYLLNVELNKAKWLKKGIEFAIDGKFYIEKNFNGIKGYHLAFEINAFKTIFIPENYKQNAPKGFIINIGYNKGRPLRKPKNKEGIIIDNPCFLKGNSFVLNDETKFVFTMKTFKSYDIDFGTIRILDFDENSMTVSFIFYDVLGINDVTVGKVKLYKDEKVKSLTMKELISMKDGMTVKDIVGDSDKPNEAVANYVINNLFDSYNDYEDFSKTENFPPVLKYAYIANSYISSIDYEGIMYYYEANSYNDTDYLLKAFEVIGSKKICNIIKKAHNILKTAEKSLGAYNDRIQDLTNEELDELDDLETKFNNELEELENEIDIDAAYKQISRYINKHLDDKI